MKIVGLWGVSGVRTDEVGRLFANATPKAYDPCRVGAGRHACPDEEGCPSSPFSDEPPSRQLCQRRKCLQWSTGVDVSSGTTVNVANSLR
jgi:hypothetical protein